MKKSFALLLFFCAIFTLAQERKHTATENVKIISEKFEIPQLKTTRIIWIYLPKDYEKSNKKYEVMYLQDAQNLFDDATSYAGEWQVDETLNKIFEKTGKSLIVVGIDNGGEKRIEELSPYKNAKYGGGNGDNYVKFIVETLKPYIDKNYRTKTDKKFTTIGGSSLGALISVYAAVKYPETFGKVLAFSSAFWFNAKDLNEFISSSKVNLKHQKYYFIQGKHEDEDMEEQTNRVIENLKSKNVKPQNIFLKIDEDGKHNEMYWRREFEGAVLWLD
jgi:predicted alpha/beta superfamily hydrolase